MINQITFKSDAISLGRTGSVRLTPPLALISAQMAMPTLAGKSIMPNCDMAHIKVTLVLNSGSRIGPGKAALLESILSNGSISAAARAMGMDYKRAWLLIDSLNQAFTSPVVERTTGGTGGGGAILTALGSDLLARYRRLEAKAANLAAVDLEALERQARPDSGPKI